MFADTALPPHLLTGMAAALGIGLLIGIDRERAKGSGSERAAAGVRTFLLLALGGAIAELVGPLGVAIAGAFVVAAIIASYRRTRSDDPGLTTEVAMLATFLLGVLAMRSAGLAAALGVVVAITLASKSRLHHFSREHLTPQELHDALLLVAAAFVVLPLLPDRPIDPWDAINPRRLWTLLVAVMLSAQTTDAAVNRCTPGLFAAAPTPAAMAAWTLRNISMVQYSSCPTLRNPRARRSPWPTGRACALPPNIATTACKSRSPAMPRRWAPSPPRTASTPMSGNR